MGRRCRNVFVETIRLGKDMRPFARWGFYGFPLCNYDAGTKKLGDCSNNFKKHNKE